MDGSALRLERDPGLRRRAARPDVDALQARIDELVRARQELRTGSSGTVDLERNRLELARAQRELSLALIDRHLPPAA